MYHRMIKRITRRNFDRVNRGDFEALLRDCAPDVHHRFAGAHTLGGERHDRETLRRWFGRLGRLCPELTLSVRDVWVSGPPHRTVVIARWTATQPLPDGSPYLNHGVHIFRLRWGKVTDIDVTEDSQLVAGSMELLAAHGRDEALAAPIVS